MGGRDISAENIEASTASQVVAAIFLEMVFDSSSVRLNSTPLSLTFDGNTFLGVGNLGKISAMEEGSTTKARGIEVSISGIDTLLLAAALQDEYQGRDATVWIGFLDPDHVFVDDPLIIFKGRMDVMKVAALGVTAELSLSIESRYADLERPRIRRYTNEDQQERWPGDKGIEFVAQVARDQEMIWGSSTNVARMSWGAAYIDSTRKN